MPKVQDSKLHKRQGNTAEAYIELNFRFLVNGQTYDCIAKTHETENLQDEPEEPLLYDPKQPTYSIMLDSLPGTPYIDERGNLQSHKPLKSFFVILPALGTIVIHGGYFILRYFLFRQG